MSFFSQVSRLLGVVPPPRRLLPSALAIASAQVQRNSSPLGRQMSRQKVARSFLFGMPFELLSGSSCAPFPMRKHPACAISSALAHSRSVLFCSPADKWAPFVIFAAPPGSGLRREISSFRLFKISARVALLRRASHSPTHLSFAVGEQAAPPQISPHPSFFLFLVGHSLHHSAS